MSQNAFLDFNFRAFEGYKSWRIFLKNIVSEPTHNSEVIFQFPTGRVNVCVWKNI